MSWIKRNLIFVVCELVALIAMGVGGYVMYGQYAEEATSTEAIQAQIAKLDELYKQNPNPGNDKVDNIKIATEQVAALKAYLSSTRTSFEKVPSIPDAPKVLHTEFSHALLGTVQELNRSATSLSVQIQQTNYFYTFEAQKNLLVYETGSPDRLAVQLGEIKAICDILFDAKVNSLDSIRRESVTSNDVNGADLLISQKSISNNLVVLAPYEVVIRGFSSELGQVLGKFATSKYGFIIPSISVEPAEEMTADLNGMNNPTPTPMPIRQGFGNGPGGRGPRGAMNYPPPATPTPANTRSQSVFLDEKPLKVTMIIYVVRPKPPGAK